MSAVASGSAQAKSTKLSTLEAKINKAGLAAPNKTISQSALFEQCGITVNQVTTDAVNTLLRKSLITMVKTSKGEVLLRFVGKDEAKSMGSMDGEEKMVFEQIKDAGNNGIWTKTITSRTGLPRTTITKVLKMLENKKAVKTVKSVKAPTRKIYMLAGLTPSVELTGGPWFTDNELDTDFVDVLKKCAYKYLQDNSVPVVPKAEQKHRYIFPTAATQHLPTVADVRDYIQNLGVASVELHEEHVESLLELMVFDGTVEKVLVNHEFTGAGNGSLSDRKRKQRPVNSDSDSDAGARRKSRKTGAKGKAGKKFSRIKRGGESESESESSESDFDSDEDAEARRKRKADAGEDDDEGKKSRRRRKKRVVRKREDSEEDASDVSMSDSDSDAAASKQKKKKAGGVDRSLLDGKTDYVYRLLRPWEPVVGWTDMPCGKCPAEAFCTEAARPLGQHHFGVGGPKIGIKLEVGMDGVGMMGGAGAAIGVSNAKWGEAKGAVGFGVAPVNPRDCHYFRDWLSF